MNGKMTNSVAEHAANVTLELFKERRRQVEGEGFGAGGDDKYRHGELARAAASYAIPPAQRGASSGARWVLANLWPWSASWWKPKDRRRDLVRAGALIIAEIQRLDRLEENGNDGS